MVIETVAADFQKIDVIAQNINTLSYVGTEIQKNFEVNQQISPPENPIKKFRNRKIQLLRKNLKTIKKLLKSRNRKKLLKFWNQKIQTLRQLRKFQKLRIQQNTELPEVEMNVENQSIYTKQWRFCLVI